MVQPRKLYLFPLLAGLLLVIGLAARRADSAKNEFRFDAATLKDTSFWTKVNDTPYRIGAIADGLCRIPTAEDYEDERKTRPHAGAYITVYVNKTGRKSMLARNMKQFPEGSVIVKQKIGNPSEGSKPVLYTIMRKRERGFNPTLGDWEFAVVGANGTDLQAIGKLENCQSCHKEKSDSDFIFRSYVPSQ